MEDLRFRFGENWASFVERLSPPQVEQAERSLTAMLGTGDLSGRRFLDIGSGSGLFSLAARRLGATVHSFDYDPDSVRCTEALRASHQPEDTGWTVERGSALDEAYLDSLGTFDVVYSWGVLHHTGDMWRALDLACRRVAGGGTLFVALYNDQGAASRRWGTVKRAYNRLPRPLATVVLLLAFVRLWGPATVRDLLAGSPGRTWREAGRERGMTPWTDVVDWVGGYPFEVAKPADVEARCAGHGFRLVRSALTDGHGCNELVFERTGGR